MAHYGAGKRAPRIERASKGVGAGFAHGPAQTARGASCYFSPSAALDGWVGRDAPASTAPKRSASDDQLYFCGTVARASTTWRCEPPNAGSHSITPTA